MAYWKFLIVAFLSITLHASAQVEKAFVIDSSAVWTNQNLDNFIYMLKSEDFEVSYDKNKIPRNIKRSLTYLTNDSFSIANPDENYRCCCSSSSSLPKRQLQFLGVSSNLVALTYLTGGVGVSTHILLIWFDNLEVKDIWAGITLKDIKSKNKLIKFLQEQKQLELNLYWFL